MYVVGYQFELYFEINKDRQYISILLNFHLVRSHFDFLLLFFCLLDTLIIEELCIIYIIILCLYSSQGNNLFAISSRAGLVTPLNISRQKQVHIVLLPKEEGDNFYLVKNSSKVKSEPPAPQNYTLFMNGNSDFIAIICCSVIYSTYLLTYMDIIY